MRKRLGFGLALLLGGVILLGACGDDDPPPPPAGAVGGSGGSGGSPELTGSACDSVDDCYPNVVDRTGIQGEILCMDRVRDGYCTHMCDVDADCCGADGECKTDLVQVCSPFESLPGKMCFLSCEPGDLRPGEGDGGPLDEQEYCQREASPDFICRSSGGGSENRKICVPGNCGVGAACTVDADCDTGLTCLTSLPGGYCGQRDCTLNADCPNGSLCVTHTDGVAYCLRTCNTPADCGFCRPSTVWGSCTDAVTYAESGTTGTVCVPPA